MDIYKKILVPLDGSEISEKILPEIEKVAACFGASISLLRVAHAITIPGQDPTEAQVAVVKAAEEYLRKIEEQIKARGYTVDSHVRYGDEAEEILDHCERNDVDLIAMSTHGRSGVKRWLLGSIAERIIRHAKKPILLVRHPG